MADLIDHQDAWNVAHSTADHAKANIARCYIELRELARRFVDSEAKDGDRQRITEIVRANDI